MWPSVMVTRAEIGEAGEGPHPSALHFTFTSTLLFFSPPINKSTPLSMAGGQL